MRVESVTQEMVTVGFLLRSIYLYVPRHIKCVECDVKLKYFLSFPNILEGRKEMFYLTTHSTHFIYVYMASDRS